MRLLGEDMLTPTGIVDRECSGFGAGESMAPRVVLNGTQWKSERILRGIE